MPSATRYLRSGAAWVASDQRPFGNRPSKTTPARTQARTNDNAGEASSRDWAAKGTNLLGVKAVMAYEGQAAMLLEGMAQSYGDILPLDQGWKITDGELDLLPLLAALADERSAERGAALFHATLAAALADWLRVVAPGEKTVVASGGCFLNQVLVRSLRARLGAQRMQIIEARQVPPNDGGIALGQVVAARRAARVETGTGNVSVRSRQPSDSHIKQLASR